MIEPNFCHFLLFFLFFQLIILNTRTSPLLHTIIENTWNLAYLRCSLFLAIRFQLTDSVSSCGFQIRTYSSLWSDMSTNPNITQNLHFLYINVSGCNQVFSNTSPFLILMKLNQCISPASTYNPSTLGSSCPNLEDSWKLPFRSSDSERSTWTASIVLCRFVRSTLFGSQPLRTTIISVFHRGIPPSARPSDCWNLPQTIYSLNFCFLVWWTLWCWWPSAASHYSKNLDSQRWLSEVLRTVCGGKEWPYYGRVWIYRSGTDTQCHSSRPSLSAFFWYLPNRSSLRWPSSCMQTHFRGFSGRCVLFHQNDCW